MTKPWDAMTMWLDCKHKVSFISPAPFPKEWREKVGTQMRCPECGESTTVFRVSRVADIRKKK